MEATPPTVTHSFLCRCGVHIGALQCYTFLADIVCDGFISFFLRFDGEFAQPKQQCGFIYFSSNAGEVFISFTTVSDEDNETLQILPETAKC